MATLDITITDGCASPNPATVSQSDANGYDKIKFKTHDQDQSYTITGLDSFLSAPSSVTISKGNDAGPYSPLGGQTDQGDHSYGVDPPCSDADDPVITVDA